MPNSEKLPPPDLPELYSRWRLDLPEREIGTNGIVGPFQDDKFAAPASTIKEVADNGWINDEWVVDMFCNALPGRPGYSMGSSPGLDVLWQDWHVAPHDEPYRIASSLATSSTRTQPPIRSTARRKPLLPQPQNLATKR